MDELLEAERKKKIEAAMDSIPYPSEMNQYEQASIGQSPLKGSLRYTLENRLKNEQHKTGKILEVLQILKQHPEFETFLRFQELVTDLRHM